MVLKKCLAIHLKPETLGVDRVAVCLWNRGASFPQSCFCYQMMDEGHSGGGSPWTSGHCSLAFVCDGSTDKTNVQNPIITPISHSEWKTVYQPKKQTYLKAASPFWQWFMLVLISSAINECYNLQLLIWRIRNIK